MQTVVLLKVVPDTVEDLTVAPDARSLETALLRFKLSDPDEHALEQALVLKEQHGAIVTVVALEAPEVDEILYTALAKGADRAVKLAGEWSRLQSFAAAAVFASLLQSEALRLSEDTLVLLRSQAFDELEGEIGPFLASRLGFPYVGVVTGIRPSEGAFVVTKEFAGGWRGEFTVAAPAVLGIQSAERPPRYVPIAKVRAAMKTGRLEARQVEAPSADVHTAVERLYQPVAAARATMLDGDAEAVANQLVEVLAKQILI